MIEIPRHLGNAILKLVLGIQGSLTAELAPDLGRFDRVVSAYTMHELAPAQRGALFARLFATQLAPQGAVVFGDIAFPSSAELERVRRDVGARWDTAEFYVVAADERVTLAALGVRVDFEPISFCAGVFTLRR